MVPQKELQELARAMKQSDEYMQMMKIRNKIMSEPVLGRQMLAFEREQARLIQSNHTEMINKYWRKLSGRNGKSKYINFDVTVKIFG